MPQVRITLDEIAGTAGRALEELAAGVVTTLGGFADLLDQRATRLAAAADRLKQALGEDHPEVVALEQTAAEAQALRVSARSAADRQARRPGLGPDEWLVFGRVLQRDGQPASDVLVRVTDADRKLKDLPAGTTDEFGDFHVAYRRQDFPETPQEVPNLFIHVEDRKQNTLYRSDSHVRFETGRAEYVEITLGEGPVAQTRAARKTPRRSAPKRPPRTRKPK
jgi:hypothetical protein